MDEGVGIEGRVGLSVEGVSKDTDEGVGTSGGITG